MAPQNCPRCGCELFFNILYPDVTICGHCNVWTVWPPAREVDHVA